MKKVLYIFLSTLFASTAADSMWLPTGQLSATSTNFVRSITSSQGGDLYASVWAVGVYKSTNNGVNWTFSGLTGKRVSYLTVAPNGNVYGLSMTQNFSYIHRSTDNGNTWTDVYTGSYPLNYAGGGSIVFPSDGSIVSAFAVTIGPTIGDVATFVFKSTNGGNDWFQTEVIGAGFVGGMVITSDGRILLGTSLAGVVYSSDNGNNFSNFTTFPPIYIKTILTASHNTIYVSDAYGLNRSTDNGLSFTDIGSHSSGVTLRAACLNSNEDIFVSMDNLNVYRSRDRGDNWVSVNEGLPANAYVYSFTLCNGKIFAGTNNSGVYVYDELTNLTASSDLINDFELSQNYPNPFNPTTSVKFEIPQSGNVNIMLYDISGKEIAVLLNEFKLAGNYNFKFNASGISSGVYFYRLQAGDFISVKKMILSK